MTSNSPVIVLDTHAILSFLLDEPGAAAVDEILSAARDGDCRVLISAMSVAEICYIVERRKGVEAVAASLALLEESARADPDLDRRAILCGGERQGSASNLAR